MFYKNKKVLKFKRKGQINIDYIFAFFVLALSIIYASNLALDSVGPFYSTLNSNNLHAEAWLFSENYLRNIETDKNVINETLIYSYANNRTKLRDSLEEKYQYRQKILIEQYPLIITKNVSGYNHLGMGLFNKTGDLVFANFTVRNYTNSVYTVVDIKADTNLFNLNETDEVMISGVNYIISKIDSKGNFVVLKRVVLSYGWGAENTDMVVVNRYSILDGFMAKINILYF